MNSTRQDILQGFKLCAGKGCQRAGVHNLKILYLNKSGSFCDSCKDSLVAEGLVIVEHEKGSTQMTRPQKMIIKTQSGQVGQVPPHRPTTAPAYDADADTRHTISDSIYNVI